MLCEFLPHKVAHLKFSKLSIIWWMSKLIWQKHAWGKQGALGILGAFWTKMWYHIYHRAHLIISHLEAYHNNGQKSPQRQKNWVKFESLLVNNLTVPWPLKKKQHIKLKFKEKYRTWWKCIYNMNSQDSWKIGVGNQCDFKYSCPSIFWTLNLEVLRVLER